MQDRSEIADFICELIENKGSETETELSDHRKKMIHDFVKENGVSGNFDKQQQEYKERVKERRLTAEQVYFDMMLKLACAPTSVHLIMTPKLLLPIIDEMLKEEERNAESK